MTSLVPLPAPQIAHRSAATIGCSGVSAANTKQATATTNGKMMNGIIIIISAVLKLK